MRKYRLLLLVVVGALLIVAMLAYVHFEYSLPMGTGPAGPHVAREAFAKPWTTHKILLLGVGDSVTAGFGVTPPYSHFNRLVRNPEDEFEDMRGICLSAVLPNLSANNMAVSDSNSLHHLETVRERLQVQDSNTFGLIVITTGGNDIIYYGRSTPREGAMYGATLDQARPWIENFENRLNQMVELLEARFPGGCMIFLANIYDPTDGAGDAQSAGLPAWPDGSAIHQAYNDVIRRCAERNPSVHVVPLYEEFLGHGIHCTKPWRSHYRRDDPHYWYYSNLVDPNIRGYDAIRRVLLIEIAKNADQLRSL
jgi:lysophospholipase L1-like esterase